MFSWLSGKRILCFLTNTTWGSQWLTKERQCKLTVQVGNVQLTAQGTNPHGGFPAWTVPTQHPTVDFEPDHKNWWLCTIVLGQYHCDTVKPYRVKTPQVGSLYSSGWSPVQEKMLNQLMDEISKEMQKLLLGCVSPGSKNTLYKLYGQVRTNWMSFYHHAPLA